MKIVARCYDRVIVHVGGNVVAMVKLGEGAEDRDGVLLGRPGFEETVALSCDVEAMRVSGCEGCQTNYGPKAVPPEGHGIFQQFSLQEGSYPWRSTRGWYCMGCSMPPR